MSILDDILNGISGLFGFNDNNQEQQTQQSAPAASTSNNDIGRKVSDIERTLMDIQSGGQDIAANINRTLGLNTDDAGNFDILGTWGDVVDFDEDDDGQADMDRILTTIPRALGAAGQTIGALPGMMVQGWSEAPTYLYSAATGSPISQEGAVDENGNIVSDNLDLGERVGSGLYGAINVIPTGLGDIAKKGALAVGTSIAKSGAKAAGRDLASDVVKREIENEAKTFASKWAPLSTAADAAQDAARDGNVVKNAAKAAGFRSGAQFLEEGSEEAIQEVAQNELNDRDLTDNVLESFIGGGLAGGTMGALRGTTRAIRNNIEGPIGEDENANTNANNNAPGGANNGAFNQPALESPYWQSDQQAQTLASVKEEDDELLQDLNIEYGGTSAMGYGLSNVRNVNDVKIGMRNLDNIFEAESFIYQDGRAHKATDFFQSLADANRQSGLFGGGQTLQEQWRHAKYSSQEQTKFIENMNAWIQQEEQNGHSLDLYLLKNPGGTTGVIKAKLAGVTPDASIALSQCGAFLLNADFDSDHYTITVDNGNQYQAARYISEMISDPSTLKDYKDILVARGLTKENKNSAVDSIKNLFTALHPNNQTSITVDEVGELADYIFSKKLGEEPSTISGKMKDFYNSGVNGIYQLISFVQEGSPVNADVLLSETEKALQSMSLFKQEDIRMAGQQVATTMQQVQGNPSNTPEDISLEEGKQSTPGKIGDVSSILEAYLKMWRKRLFIDLSRGEIVCRENLSIYFTIKDQAETWIEGHFGEVTNTADLLKAFAKSQIGIELFAAHPETIASTAVYAQVKSESLAEYRKQNGLFIGNGSDWSNLESIVEQKYKEKCEAFFEAVKVYDQDAFEIISQDGFALPSWPDESDSLGTIKKDKIMLSVFGDEDTENFFGLKTKNKSVSSSLESLADMYSYNVLNIDDLYSGENIGFAKTMLDRFVEVKKHQAEIAGENVVDEIKKVVEQSGLKQAFSNFQEIGYDISKMNSADHQALTYFSHALSFWGGRKDFGTAGFSTDIDLFENARNDQGIYGRVSRDLFSGDVSKIKNSLLDLTFLNKFKDLHKAFIELAESDNLAAGDNIKNKIIHELKTLQQTSPFCRIMASYLGTRLQLDGDISAIKENARTLLSSSNFFDKMYGNHGSSVRDTYIQNIIEMADTSKVVSSDAWFAFAMESKADTLDLQTISSRARKARPYARQAALQNAAILEARKEQVFKVLNGISVQEQSTFMEALKLKTLQVQHTFPLNSFFHAAAMINKIDKQNYNKTNVVHGAQNIWTSSSIAIMGYTPNEFQNLSLSVVDSGTISSNPQLASILFMTDYIKEQGGVRIYFADDGTTTETFKDRYELMSAWLSSDGNKRTVTEENFGISTLRELCDVCPNMINLIQPVSTTSVDIAGEIQSITGIKKGNSIEDILKSINVLPTFDNVDTSNGINFTYRVKEEIKNEQALRSLLTTREGLVFALTALNWEEIPGLEDLHARNIQIKNQLTKDILPWYREYLEATPDHRLAMRQQLLGRTYDSAQEEVLSILGTINVAVENMGDENLNLLNEEKLVQEFFAYSNLEEARKIATLSEDEKKFLDMLGKKGREKAGEANKELAALAENSQDFSKLFNIDSIEQLVKSELTFDYAFYLDAASNLAELADATINKSTFKNNLKGARADKVQSLGKAINEMQEMLNQIKRIKAQITITERKLPNLNISDTKKNAIESGLDALYKSLEARRMAIKTIQDITKFQKDFYEGKVNASRYSELFKKLSKTTGKKIENPLRLLNLELLRIENYNLSNPDKLETMVSDFLNSLNLFREEHTAVSGDKKLYKGLIESLSKTKEDLIKLLNGRNYNESERDALISSLIKTGTSIACKALCEAAQTSFSRDAIKGNHDMSLAFVGDSFSILQGLDSMINREDPLQEMHKISTNTAENKRKNFGNQLRLHLTKDMDVYQASNIAMSILTGNVEIGTSNTASQRNKFTSLMFAPDETNFSVLSDDSVVADTILEDNGIANKTTTDDLANEYITADEDEQKWYYGYYKELDGNDNPTGDWKPLSPTTITHWRYANTPSRRIFVRLVRDESAGFETSGMRPPRDGRPFNQFLNVLAKILINAAEPLMLKTAKKPEAFAAAHFVNTSEKIRRQVTKNCSVDLTAAGSDPAAILTATKSSLLAVKQSYRNMLNKTINNTGRKELDLDEIDIKQIVDATVQGVVIEWSDHSRSSIMYRDILRGENAVAAKIPLDNQGRPLTALSAEVHVFGLTELGSKINKMASTYYMSNAIPNAAGVININDAALWKEAVKHSLCNLEIDIVSKSALANKLNDMFSRCYVRDWIPRDRFAIPQNAKANLNHINSNSGSELFANDAFSRQYNNSEYNIVKVYRSNNQNNYLKNRGTSFSDDFGYLAQFEDSVSAAQSLTGQKTLVLPGADIRSAFQEAEKKGNRVIVAYRPGDERKIITAIQEFSGFRQDKNVDLTDFKEKYFDDNILFAEYYLDPELGKFYEKLPEANYDATDNPNNWVYVAYSPYCTAPDGSYAATAASADWIRKTQAKVTGYSQILFNKYSKGSPVSSTEIVSYDQVRNTDHLDDEAIRIALEAVGVQPKEIEQRISGIKASFDWLKQRKKKDFSSDSLYCGECFAGGDTVVGLCKRTFGSKTFTFPIIIPNLPEGSSIQSVLNIDGGGNVDVYVETPLFGSTRQPAGAVKLFFPDSATKGTLDLNFVFDDNGLVSHINGVEPTHSVIINRGGGNLDKRVDCQFVTQDEFQGGKVDIYEYLRKEYTNFMRQERLSLWFTEYKTGNDSKWKINYNVFDNRWTPEQIANFFTGTNRKEIARLVTIGKLGFNTGAISNKIIRKIFSNCYDYNADPFEALSGVIVNPRYYSDLFSGINVDLQSIEFTAESLLVPQGQYNNALIWDNIMPGDVQEMFHTISNDHFESRYGSENKNATFNKYGMVNVDVEGRGKERMWVLIGKPNFDTTQTLLQNPAIISRIGNKQKLLNAFNYRDVANGGTESLVYEMLEEVGLSRMGSRWARDRIKQMKPRISNGDNSRAEYDSALYDELSFHSLSGIEYMERLVHERLYDDIKREWDDAVPPICDRKNNRLSTGQVSETEFQDKTMNRLKHYLEVQIYDGKTMSCKSFLDWVRYSVTYTKDATDSISFYEKDLYSIFDEMGKNSREIDCMPFTGLPTIRKKDNSFIRFGMPIIDQRLWQDYLDHNARAKQKWGQVSDEDIYNKMLEIFKATINQSQNSISEKQRRSLYAVAEHIADGTPIAGNEEFLHSISGLSVREMAETLVNIDESLLGDAWKDLPEIRAIIADNKKLMENVFLREAKAKRLSYNSSLSNTKIGVKQSIGEQPSLFFVDRLCSLKRINSLAGEIMLLPSSVGERYAITTPIQWLAHLGLKGHGPLSSKVLSYMSEEDLLSIMNGIKAKSKDANVQKLFGSIRSATAMGDFDRVMDAAAHSASGMTAFLQERIDNGGWLNKAANMLYSWSSGKNIGSYKQIDVFLSELMRLISRDEVLAKTYLSTGKFQEAIDQDLTGFISECFRTDGPLYSVAKRAFNHAMQGDAAQNSVMSTIINEYASHYTVIKLFTGTLLCPFVQYSTNVTFRNLGRIFPMSTFRHLLTDFLSKNNSKMPGLGYNWSDIDWTNIRTTETIQEALKLDMLNIGTTGVACLLLGLGCMEPPDDDDKWGNVDEWTFMGQRISVNWWLKDIVGPALGLACAWKSAMLGKPNVAVLFNDMATCMYSNPIMRAGDVVSNIVNPYETYEAAYYNDLERYSSMEDAKMSGSEVLFADFSVSAINWLMGFCTPAILKDLYKNSQTYEVSHKKIYETDATGQRTEDSYTEGATQNTTYFDAKLREQTKKNPVLAWLCDMFVPHTTGYFASEMPRTVYYDPAQMDSYKALSLYTTDEYGNKVQKSDEECQAIALGIIIQLQSYGSMEELAKTGFCVPYDTLDYVSDMVWDIANGTTSLYEDYVSSGALDPYVLGDGDYETGTAMAEEIKSAYENTYSYWKSFYYDKLWSDEMKQGLVKYNRYATYYEQDANGEWYANGYRRSLGNIVSPFLVASGAHSDALGIDDHGSNMGYDEDWATQSVVTGMSTGERVLVPRVEDVETPKFESRADDNNNGYSKNYTTTYGSGSRSYGSSGSYKKSSAFNYTAPKNSLSFATPYANTIDTPKINTTPYKNANFDRLYPSFETQGSRKAYKREDF